MYVANIWKNSAIGYRPIPLIEKSGWSSNGDIKWIEDEKAFPEHIASLLANNTGVDEEFDLGEDSEDEDEIEERDLLENSEDCI